MQHATTVITGGLLADGSGGEPRPADILIADERIAAIERAARIDPASHRLLDATGLVVAPGFIDVHSHADNAPLLTEDDTSKVLQGITTEVVGNCGISLAPTRGPHAQSLGEYLSRLFPPVRLRWSGLAEFLDVTDAAGYVTNYCPLVGHGTLRIAAFGVANRPPTSDELRLMRELLDDALGAGVFGLSTGLIYPPGTYAPTDELAALAADLGPDRVYTTHLRSEGTGLAAAIDEALAIGQQAGCRVQVSHLKAVGRTNWGGVARALDALDIARSRGVAVRQDAYPYTASSTMLATALPPTFLAGTADEILDRLRRPTATVDLTDALAQEYPGWDNRIAAAGWDGIVVASSASGRFDGRTLGEVAQTLDLPPVEALRRLLVTEQLRVTVIVFWMSEDDVATALAHPHTIVGSDGLPPGAGGTPHPRGYGTFPRVLGHFVRERRVTSLGDAIRRMTSLPAVWFGIPGRGYVKPGYFADLVAFDPCTVGHSGGYRSPTQPPEGVAWVMQAGHVVVRDNRYVGPRRGRRLTPC